MRCIKSSQGAVITGYFSTFCDTIIRYMLLVLVTKSYYTLIKNHFRNILYSYFSL